MKRKPGGVCLVRASTPTGSEFPPNPYFTPVIQPFLTNIRRYVSLSDAARADLERIARLRQFERRSLVSRPGQIAQTRNYVVKGAFRSYYVDPSGKEHTIQLSIEDWFISDFHSYITREPGTLFVESVEAGTLLQFPYDDIEALCARHVELSEYFRRTTERAFAFSRIRVQADISKTAEERYRAFYARYPDIVHRMPQYAVASYLGMSAEFLSKIRARMANGK